MKMPSFILITLLAAAIPASYARAGAYVVSTPNGALMEFADIEIYFPSKWAEDNVKLAERLGIGYAERNQPYNRPLTRRELAYVAVKLYEVMYGSRMTPISDEERNLLAALFTDSYQNGRLFEDEVFLAIKHNIMYGTSETAFSPEGFVTREQTAAVLYRVTERFMNMEGMPRANLESFSDSGEISLYARDCFATMVAAGVLSGVSADRLAPKAVCTYEEVLSVSVRLLQGFSGSLNADLYTYYGALLESPLVVNAHTTSIEYQGGIIDILDAEWVPEPEAIGYAVDCVRPGGAVMRTITNTTGVTVFQSDSYEDISVYSIGMKGGMGIIGEYGSSLISPPEPPAEYTDIYIYNDYGSIISISGDEERVEAGFEGANPKNITPKQYSSNQEALYDMTEITVPIWKMGENNTRISATASMYIHSAVAQDVIDIFEDIYNGPEQFPIYAVLGFSWRGEGSKSSHNQGLAIDINPDHNYFIDTQGEILAGKLWEPYLSPYSIKPDGDVVRAFNKRGWFWGGIGWPTTGKDFMHFSYTGV